MTFSLGLMIELLVAVLLVLTIGYCFVLNRRLKRLHADEESLRATISELITATEIAERAIMGLKMTANECDESLGQRLSEAEWFSKEISQQLGAGEVVLKRISQIALVADQKTAEPENTLRVGSISEQATSQASGINIRRAAAETADRLKALRRQNQERVA